MKIAVDAMGGDNAPAVEVEGAVHAAKEFGTPIILVGDRPAIEAELERHRFKGDDRITIRHTTEVIGMDESPIQSIRSKRDSSTRVCFELVKAGEAAGVVTAGNSGAAMAAGVLFLKKLKGVDRPALAVCMPTVKEPAVLLDVGGNVDCRPVHLLQFAVMGEVYARYVLKKSRPTIGVLSNGEEEGKGNDLTRGAHELIKKTSLNYVGYVEGRDIYCGDVDVVVSDGFVGNVALKLSEGLVEAVVTMLKTEIMASLPAKFGYLFSRGAFKRLKKKVDYAEYGGAPLLGIDGICIICHGGSPSKAIKNAVVKAYGYAKDGVNERLTEELAIYHDAEELTGT